MPHAYLTYVFDSESAQAIEQTIDEKTQGGDADKTDEYTVSDSIGLGASGSGDETYRIPVYLADTWSVNWQWASLSRSDGTADADIYLKLKDETLTTVDSISMASSPNIIDKSDNGTEYTNSTGTDQRYYMVVENTGGTSYDPDAGDPAIEFATYWNIER